MEYRVEELAGAAGVRVDTIRFYQAKGLLPAPKRVRREAVYRPEHLARLKQIRRYQSQGLSLAVIKRLLAGGSPSRAAALLRAVADRGGERSFTRAEVAARSGVPEALLLAVESAGLLQPVQAGGEPRYGEADVQLAEAGMEILRHGFPLDELLRLSIRHAKGVDAVVERAVALFDGFVRKAGRSGPEIADIFRRLLPAVTTLVALHFQRTLLNHALERLRQRGEGDVLEAAQAVVDSGRLEVTWR
ncbi:MAG: MerR family transcriptional regulator [Deltaproteobacteria bacterium]|nr:MerR family transcriptional regulator [Deltaproteobacteria bacterium]